MEEAPIDFSRTELNWAIDLIEKVGKEGHMDALALVDTFGVLSPHAMKYFVTQVQKLHSLTNKKMLSHAEFRDLARATLGKTQQQAAE